MRIIIMFLFFCIGNVFAVSVRANVSSQFLVRGEQAILQLLITDAEPLERLVIPPIPGFSIKSFNMGEAQTTMLEGRKLGYVYQFGISSFEVGKQKIPSIEITTNKGVVSTEEISLEIFDSEKITFSQTVIGNNTINYAAFFHVSKTDPYEGEVLPVELKIYFPADQRVEDWGIPEFEREGITAWRFEPRPQTGNAILLGKNYRSISYPSTMSATHSGEVTMGPATLRVMTIQNTMGSFGIQQDYFPVNLNISPLNLDAKELPPSAPPQFKNAVGSFSISATATNTEIREGDSINVDLTITGSGNLDSISPPTLQDAEYWKLYDPQRNSQGEARREKSGVITFRQFMRPLKRQTLIPPFELCYFDPDLREYKTISTAPIPLTVIPSTNSATMNGVINQPPVAGITPIEKMSDILGIIDNGEIIYQINHTKLSYLWHLVPLVIVLFLLTVIFRKKILLRYKTSNDVSARKQAFKKLEKSPSDIVSFLKNAGTFIETWLPTKTSEALIQRILHERDQTCFQPHNKTPIMQSSRRKEILTIIKKNIPSLIIFIITSHSFLHGETTTPSIAGNLYQEGKYHEAIESWLGTSDYNNLTPETLFNIGNACYRMGSPGYAALYYHRALMNDSSFIEAKQNLRFLERKFGSIKITYQPYQYTLEKISLSWINNIILGSIWLVIIGLLICIITTKYHRLRTPTLMIMVICPFLIIIAFVIKLYYPSNAKFASYQDQAVIIAEKAIAYNEASRTSSMVIDAPVGSLCKIIRRSDRWVYIAFTTNTRGWIPAGNIEMLIPKEKQKAPKIIFDVNPT
jgi:BatD DUF11 like domain